MRQGLTRKRVKSSALSSALPHNDEVSLPDHKNTTIFHFTCRRFLLLQTRWCKRTRTLRLIVVALFFSLFVIAAHTAGRASRKRRRVFPRYIRYDHDDPVVQPTPIVRRLDLDMELYPSKRTIYVSKRDQEAQDYLKNSKDFNRNLQGLLETDECKAQYDWQLKSYPTCNIVHETDITNLHARRYKDEQVRLIADGYYRDVWTVRDGHEKRILKTLRFEHDYVPRNYERHRRDAVAMERLTSSPHILDIYGYCGNSGVFEHGDGGDVTRLLWPSRKETKRTITQEQKLNVAAQLTSAIAAMHNVDMEGRASIAHTDITPGQFVKVNGMYRLNDFNRARFLLWNKVKGEACGYYVANNPGKNRSPEEYKYEEQSEKVDIYSLGNIFYMLLTQKWPWEELKGEEAMKQVEAGKRPHVPNSIRNSTDPVDKILMEALSMAQKQDPKERATARQIESLLKGKLMEVYPKAMQSWAKKHSTDKYS